MQPRAYISGAGGEDEECVFRQCIKRAMCGSSESPKDPIPVEVSFDAGTMKLHMKLATKGNGVPFEHSRQCPAADCEDSLPRDQDAAAANPVRVAVSLVVQDARGCVLLTKRGEAMRKFPGAWVIPGGHLDPNETLEEAAIRELGEEVGLSIKESTSPCMLCVWESTYPHLLSLGPPVVQHVVVYYTCTVDANSGNSGKGRGDEETHDEKRSGQGLSMQEVEVAECCWLNPSQVAVLCDRQGDCDASVESLVRGEGGGHVTGRVDVGSIRDRLAEGTRFALLQWLHAGGQ